MKSVLDISEYVAITTDMWTSETSEGCLTGTVYYYDQLYHAADNVFNILNQICT